MYLVYKKVLKKSFNETKYIIHFVKFQEWQKTFENLGDTWKFNA